MKKETRDMMREMGFEGSTKQIMMQVGLGAVLGIALLGCCAVGEWLCGM